MKISIIRPGELGPQDIACWRRLQQSHASLHSPCFTPEFTFAVAAVRPRLRVAVLEQDGGIAGFFPFEGRWGAGLPVAGRFSDHHGVVAAPTTRWDWQALLRACGLGYWPFDHLPAWQQPPVELKQTSSPGLDLSGGYEAWLAGRLTQGSTLASLPRKLRKLEREVGPIRFEADCRDRAVFDTVLRLKSQQCRRTGQLDSLAWPWARQLLEQVWGTDTPGFGGRLSALYAGETLVAAHLGMRSCTVWHWWFPVYSQEHHRYSPGAQLLLHVARAAARSGHALLDLGKGDEPYKAAFADTALPLVEGIVHRPAPITVARSVRKHVGHWLRVSPLAQPLRPLLRGFELLRHGAGAN
jgi:CelD/BcsL family acetyltransferase involved in cellulose biosynthesis